MKKIIIFTLLFFFFWIDLASADFQGKVYAVKSGDTVYEIATEIFGLNWSQIKPKWQEKDLIYPGDRISLREIRKNKRIYCNVGGNPYRGSWQKALKNSNLPADVKKELEKKIRKDQFTWYKVKSGDEFSQLNFGQGEIWNNVICRWQKTQLYAAKKYSTNRYQLIQILWCGNWAWWKKQAPPPPKPPPPPPVVSAKLQTKLVENYKRVTPDYDWDWDSTAGVFKEHYQDGNDVGGWWQTTVLYPLVFEDMKGNQWSFGLAYSSRNWQGETGSHPPFDYEGDVDLWSLAGRYRDTNRDWEVIGRLGLGDRDDSGSLEEKAGVYSMEQKTDIFNLYTSVEYQGREDKKWFSKTRFSAEAEFGFSEEKKDYWTDNSGQYVLAGSADDKDLYNLTIYSDIYSFDPVRDTVGIWSEFRSSYYDEGYKWGNGIKGGLSFLNEAVKIGYGWTWWNKGQPDADGFYGEINFYNLWHWFRAPRDKDFDKEINQEKKEQEIIRILKGGGL